MSDHGLSIEIERDSGLLVSSYDGERLLIDPSSSSASDPFPISEEASDFAGCIVLNDGIGRRFPIRGGLPSPCHVHPFALALDRVQRIFRPGLPELPEEVVPLEGEEFKIGPFGIRTIGQLFGRIQALVIEAGKERAFIAVFGLPDAFPITKRSDWNEEFASSKFLVIPKAKPLDLSPDERELGFAIQERLEESRGLALVGLQTPNLERFRSLHDAIKKSGRTFIIDPYMAETIEAGRDLGISGLPSVVPGNDDGILVYTPRHQYLRLKEAGRGEILEKYLYPSSVGVLFQEVSRDPSRYAALFRGSQIKDPLMQARLPFEHSFYIHAMWRGYLRKGSPLADFLDKKRIPSKVYHRGRNPDAREIEELRKQVRGRREIIV